MPRYEQSTEGSGAKAILTRLHSYSERHKGVSEKLTKNSALQNTQAVVQLGEVVTSLGDRVWATWFASGAATASPQNVSVLGTARVPLKVCDDRSVCSAPVTSASWPCVSRSAVLQSGSRDSSLAPSHKSQQLPILLLA